MAAIEARSFRIGFGICLAGYALYMLLRSPARAPLHAVHSATHSVIGFIAGAVGGLTAMPGALLVVWCELRGLSKEKQRALVQPFIIAIQVFAIGLFCFQPGAIGLDLFQRLVVALPAVGLGTFIGTSMFAKVNDRIFRYSALFIILASGCLMVFSRPP